MRKSTTHSAGRILTYGANNSIRAAIINRRDEQAAFPIRTIDRICGSLFQHHQLVLPLETSPQSREHLDWNVLSAALEGSAFLDRILEGTW